MKTLAVLLLSLSALSAQINEAIARRSSITSLTITPTQLAIPGITVPISVEAAVSGSGVPIPLSAFSYNVDSSGNLNINFFSSFTGTVFIEGPWPRYTTASTDFAMSVGTVGSVSAFLECAGCPMSPASRYLPATGKTYVSQTVKSLTWSDSPSTTYSVFAYLRGNRVTYGISATAVGDAVATGADIEWGVSSMPSGVLPLGDTTITSGTFGGTVNDDRPANFKSNAPTYDNQSEPVIIIVNAPTGGPCGSKDCNCECSCSSGLTCQCGKCICAY